MKPTRRTALLASCAGLLAVVATYAVMRLVQVRFFPEPNPALVVATMRIAMFWRLGMGAYLGAITFVVVLFSGEPRAERWTLRAIIPVAVLAFLQAVVFP